MKTELITSLHLRLLYNLCKEIKLPAIIYPQDENMFLYIDLPIARAGICSTWPACDGHKWYIQWTAMDISIQINNIVWNVISMTLYQTIKEEMTNVQVFIVDLAYDRRLVNGCVQENT